MQISYFDGAAPIIRGEGLSWLVNHLQIVVPVCPRSLLHNNGGT